MQPLVSVICFAFQQEAYIRDALDGFIAQQVDFPIEIIVHDDASTDNTAQIIREYAEAYPKLFKPILQTENQYSIERGRVTRLCIEAAKGKYVAICEGDDYWTDSGKLQAQVDFMESNPNFSACFHNVMQRFDDGSNTPARPFREYDKDTFTLEDTFATRALFHTCSLLCRKDAMTYPQSSAKIRSGDMALFSIIATHGPLKLLSGNMGVYRKNKGGITNDEALVDYHNHRIELWKRLNAHFNGAYSERFNQLIAHHRNELRKLKPTIIQKVKFRLYRIFNKPN